MKETELKPCPFCGGKAELKQTRVYYDRAVRIRCLECGCSTKPILIGRPHLTVNGVDESTRYTEEQATNKVAEIWNRSRQ